MNSNNKKNSKNEERRVRIKKMIQLLKKKFPDVKMALNYSNDWELLVAVVLSAQCTDIRVNIVTADLFKKYKTLDEYVKADLKKFEQDIRSTGFYRNKAKNILASAKMLKNEFGGIIPCTMDKILTMPGVARKTANVVLGNAYGVVEGIAVDTHVKRFVQKFDLSDSKDPKIIERDLMDMVPKKDWFILTYLFIEYGREVCKARVHDCEEHFLTKIYPKGAFIWPKSK